MADIIILKKEEIERIIQRMAFEVLERHGDLDELVIVGIQRRGVFLGQRISDILEKYTNTKIPFGMLDINLYRDDWTNLQKHPKINKTEITVSLSDKNILLTDDVIYTGRTVRAAIDAILDYGRPSKVELLVLVDRGHRELPIHPDYCGKKINTSKNEYVDVFMKEIDGEDKVILHKKK